MIYINNYDLFKNNPSQKYNKKHDKKFQKTIDNLTKVRYNDTVA